MDCYLGYLYTRYLFTYVLLMFYLCFTYDLLQVMFSSTVLLKIYSAFNHQDTYEFKLFMIYLGVSFRLAFT
jgi:hypothetical protein